MSGRIYSICVEQGEIREEEEKGREGVLIRRAEKNQARSIYSLGDFLYCVCKMFDFFFSSYFKVLSEEGLQLCSSLRTFSTQVYTHAINLS